MVWAWGMRWPVDDRSHGMVIVLVWVEGCNGGRVVRPGVGRGFTERLLCST